MYVTCAEEHSLHSFLPPLPGGVRAHTGGGGGRGTRWNAALLRLFTREREREAGVPPSVRRYTTVFPPASFYCVFHSSTSLSIFEGVPFSLSLPSEPFGGLLSGLAVRPLTYSGKHPPSHCHVRLLSGDADQKYDGHGKNERSDALGGSGKPILIFNGSEATRDRFIQN